MTTPITPGMARKNHISADAVTTCRGASLRGLSRQCAPTTAASADAQATVLLTRMEVPA